MPEPVRPHYQKALDNALLHRGEISVILDAIRAELPWLVRAPRTKYAADRFRGELATEQFLEDGILAGWLPVLVHMQSDAVGSFDKRLSALLQVLQRESTRRQSHSFFGLYPLILLLVALGLVLLISIAIVPTFQKMFSEFQLRLASPTRLLFYIASWINNAPWASAGVVLFFAMVLYGFVRGFRYAIEWSQMSWLLGSITAGNSGNVEAMSRFMSVLAEMLQLGAPIPESLRVAGLASQRRHLRRRASQFAQEWQEYGNAPKQSRVAHNFPQLMIHALKAGPDGDPCIPLIRQLATIYHDRSSSRVEWSSHWANPIAVMFIGLIVGGVVVSILMPLISLVTSLS